VTEWGPWIEHDGKGCPPEVVGRYIQIASLRRDGTVKLNEGVVRQHHGRDIAWLGGGSEGGWWIMPIIRYRIRKPRALLQLIDAAENLPAPERVDA
jgi:hypothetical protein